MTEQHDSDIKCLTRIEGKVDAVHGKVDVLHRDFVGLMTKLILGMIAIAGAVVGIKYAGTPLITDISFFLSWATVIFGLGILLRYWGKLKPKHRMVWISFITFVFTSVFSRTFIFEAGVEPSPWWYPPLIDVLMAWVCISLIINAAKRKFH